MKILISGDYAPQKRISNAIGNDDYSFFNDYRSIRNRGDIDFSILNLECPITEDSDIAIEKYGPNLNCNKKVLHSLSFAGVNMVTLANNHINDYGASAVLRTQKLCEEHGIITVGVGKDLHEANRIKYVNINEKILAIINCCEHEYSIALENKAGANPLNPISQYKAIHEARKKADYVIVIVHGGHENFQLPSLRMKEIYRFFIDVGADTVINHHQHCYSGYEVYNDKPIFYGIGNLCFDKGNNTISTWNEGYMLILSFNEQNRISFEIIPYHQATATNMGVELKRTGYFDKRINELNKIIANDELLKSEIDKYYDNCIPLIKNIFSPYANKFLLSLRIRNLLPSFISPKIKSRIQNYINCESHLDKVKYYFNR